MRSIRSLTTRKIALGPPLLNSGPRPESWAVGAVRPLHDAAGNRDSDTYLGNRLEVDVPAYTTTVTDDNASTSFDPYDVLHPAKLKTSLAAVTERYDFDGQNRLFEVTRDDIKLASTLSRNGDYVTPASESSTPFIMERRRYDALGQLLEVGAADVIQGDTLRMIYGAADPDQPQGNAMPSIGDDLIRMQYDKLGRMLRQTTLGSDRQRLRRRPNPQQPQQRLRRGRQCAAIHRLQWPR
jgi:hypothetical protein